jgi:hypothetical protein
MEGECHEVLRLFFHPVSMFYKCQHLTEHALLLHPIDLLDTDAVNNLQSMSSHATSLACNY